MPKIRINWWGKITSEYNHSLVVIAFPKKELDKLFVSDSVNFKEIVYWKNTKALSFGNILDVAKYSNYCVLNIEIRKDETPFWYFSDVIKEALNQKIEIHGPNNDKIAISKGKIKIVLINGKNIEYYSFPEKLIIDFIQYKLIRRMWRFSKVDSSF